VTDDDLRDRVIDALGGLPIRSRRLFGGYGLYLGEKFFGVVSDRKLYFRTDEASRPSYRQRGMPPLQPRYRPRGPKTVDRNFQVPQAIVDDIDALREWALRAASTKD
jgi:DNA transformation protein